jgi:uncharacterized protein (TIGR01777 family)
MNIVVSGASGLVGSALVPALRSAGHGVSRLVRGRAAQAPDEIAWRPEANEIDVDSLEGTDAIVNLAGENIGQGRWTAARRERILRSRVDATRTLVSAMGRMQRRPEVFVSASAIGYYGNRGEEVVTEESRIGHGFLPEVCLAWETHADGAARQGIRTVVTRFGVILAKEGGALARLLPLFRAGLGGRLGSGQQWMSWISLEDVAGGILHVLRDSCCAGRMNFVAPAAVTNAEFTRALGHALRRPTLLSVPAWALRIAVGSQMANDALLASARAAPQRLSEVGYVFRHPTIASAFEAMLEVGRSRESRAEPERFI